MRMETKKAISPLVLAFAAAVLALVSLFAFQGWIAHSADIFLSLGQAGLAWCL